jgi:hypothetical protein
MKGFWALVFLAALLPAGVRAKVDVADGIKNVEPEIEAYVKKRAAQEGGTPYISALVRGDIDGDAKEDVFISYGVEGIGGGNFSLLFQALFLKDGKRLIFRAERVNGSFGTAQGKSYTPKKIEKGRVVCETDEYGPDDGACCPSIKGKGEILFRDGKLIEAKSIGRVKRAHRDPTSGHD